jgi:hypothetical protein
LDVRQRFFVLFNDRSSLQIISGCKENLLQLKEHVKNLFESHHLLMIVKEDDFIEEVTNFLAIEALPILPKIRMDSHHLVVQGA